eukprot:m.16801 g.16801  ORF g.16801 m.16801 type:complete len:586 (+) comp27150_c0_seq1:158-1915(+)
MSSSPSHFDVTKKADELFFTWFTHPGTQDLLRTQIELLLAGEAEKASFTGPTPSNQPQSALRTSPLAQSSPSPASSPTSPRDSPPPAGLSSFSRSPSSPLSPRGDVSPRFTRKKSVEVKRFNAQQASGSQATWKGGSAPVRVPDLPRFYFRYGRPKGTKDDDDARWTEIQRGFDELGGHATREDFPTIVKACGLPLYWKAPLFVACGGDDDKPVTSEMLSKVWDSFVDVYHDDASQFMWILTKGSRDYLIPADFEFLLQDIVDTHPGLTILADSPDFQVKYVETVVARIFFSVNRSWSGRISLFELRRSTFLTVLALLETESDINQVMEYFSYEHFYVIYCKFWELDTDHDMLISSLDIARYQDYALPQRLVQRIFSEAVLRDLKKNKGKMSYRDFVWFLLADEDKQHPTSIEYWFRLMDLDGDGVLSMYELEYFYEQQKKRMESRGIEALSVEDCLCQILDMVKPRIPNQIGLRDIKRTQVACVFFNTFVNVEKYLEYEQRDPFAKAGEGDSELNAWERFCQRAYDKFVTEEQMAEEYLEDEFDDDGLEDELIALKSPVNSPDLETKETLEQADERKLASLLMA